MGSGKWIGRRMWLGGRKEKSKEGEKQDDWGERSTQFHNDVIHPD